MGKQTRKSFTPSPENLQIIKRNKEVVATLEERKVPCLCCNHKTIILHQKTETPVYVSQKCSLCSYVAPYNLADYRRGVSLLCYRGMQTATC